MAKISYAERWSLYWLSSDGEEDCFVVARNTRSAAKVDEDYCGFEHGYVAASKVCSIPADVASRWIKKRKKEWHLFELPWYADNWVLKQLGAQFRERDNLHETLIDDVVYTQSNDGPIPPRLIGRKHLLELQSIKAFKRYGHVRSLLAEPNDASVTSWGLRSEKPRNRASHCQLLHSGCHVAY